MVIIRMTSLRRLPTGDWYARKRIPEDVREVYLAGFNVRQEERFRRPATLPQTIATQEFRDWDAEIVSRIERLRAKARGDGEMMLTQRQAHALACEWYSWFVARCDEEADTPARWDVIGDEFEEANLEREPRDEHADLLHEEQLHTPAVRRAVHRLLLMRGDVEGFLRERDRMLSDAALGMLLDALEGEFLAALKLLRRHAEGDWRPDNRPEGFPPPASSASRSSGVKPSGLTVWAAFELWIGTRTPAAASINRWRAVIVGMRANFGERDIATITVEEAQAWIDGLVSDERSAHTVLEVWLRAARTVFAWAVKKRRLADNPFAKASFPVPKRPAKLRGKHFREEELQVILRATLLPPPPRLTAHKAVARRWVPWVCAYTGCRPGEACQLRAEDIFQHAKGFWVMRITPEAGTVKDREAREVPLHYDLVSRGFVEFAKRQRSGPLFYAPEAARNGVADPTNPRRPPYVIARAKLADWTNTLGLNLKGVSPMHAWRHTFVQRARAAGIDRSIRFAMCGHAEGEQGTEGDGYAPAGVEECAEAMAKFPRYEL